MTAPESADPGATTEQLDEAARLLGSYAGELREALTSVRALVADVAADWQDPGGAGWVDRADLVRRDLDRHADDAADLATRTARAAEDSAARAVQESALQQSAALVGQHALREGVEPARTVPDPAAGALPVGPLLAGPLLGGTEGRRVLPGTGMRIATLPDPPAR
ncbi:WXG100 family type VII secretion target [Pseudonocardia sp. N23]|uniref:WXG100 family type VII secretion target n=1 Tax=Pseudonocardia sp. N23 TaxID=1987376 RepID=UPI000BFDD55E|nr:hypothetical protein [Pseudonocardia sp. N23]GAY10155.1 hypothetical protein TOK_4511 [Pseudonocardia sp. N23]